MASQSARRTAIIAAIHTHYLTNGTAETLPPGDYALVTYAPIFCCALLVLVVGISMGVCLLMREKRKRIQEATSLQNLPWIDTLEVFTVSGREGAAGIFMPQVPATGTPSPPPAYDSVVKNSEKEQEAEQQKLNGTQPPVPTPEPTPPRPATDDLPSYEAAVRMEANL